MANICLTVGAKVSTATMMASLNSIEGLKSWWTSDTSGDTAEGGTVLFRFGGGGMDMKVLKSTANSVSWQCTGGPDEWLGTTVSLSVEEKDGHSELMFKHAGWAAETPFHHHCSMKWASFLLSLKQYLETGQGRAFPNDIQIAA